MPSHSADSEIEAMAERAKRYPYGATWPGCGLSPDSPLWPPSRFYGGHMVASGLTIGKAGQGHWDPLNFFLPVANRALDMSSSTQTLNRRTLSLAQLTARRLSE